MDNRYLSEVNKTIRTVFSKMVIIDPLKDELYEYNVTGGNIIFNKNTSLMEYIDKSDEIVSSDDKEIYIKLLSGNFDDKINANIKMSGNYGYEDSLVLAKKIPIDSANIILLLFASYKSIITPINEKENLNLAKTITESILKINNMMANYGNSSLLPEFISIELENLINENQELKTEYSKGVIEEANASKNTILIIDDDFMTRSLLKKAFIDEYDILEAKNGKEAIEILSGNTENDVKTNFVGIFLDLLMPVMDGFAVLEYLEDNNMINKMPIIILSALEERESIKRVYKYNIADMLEKPFDMDIIKLRTGKFIKLYQSSNVLNKLLVQKDSYTSEMVKLLKDKYFVDNEYEINVVSKITGILASKYMELYPNSKLTQPLIDKIVEASKYYDIGKLFINNNSSIEEKQKHVNYGADFIEKLFENSRDKILSDYAKNIALYHHERYDGNGYNTSMSKEKIPLYVSFVILASEYYHIYKNENVLTHSIISSRIASEENKKYSPEIINTFKHVLGEISLVFEQKK